MQRTFYEKIKVDFYFFLCALCGFAVKKNARNK